MKAMSAKVRVTTPTQETSSVDGRSRHPGRLYHLCWQLGEPHGATLPFSRSENTADAPLHTPGIVTAPADGVDGAVAVSGWKKQLTADAAASCDALLIRIAGGDEVAFAELYDRICSQLLGLVERFRVGHVQAEEALRLIFLEIWRTAPLFAATNTSAAAWILHLAHSHAVERG